MSSVRRSKWLVPRVCGVNIPDRVIFLLGFFSFILRRLEARTRDFCYFNNERDTLANPSLHGGSAGFAIVIVSLLAATFFRQ